MPHPTLRRHAIPRLHASVPNKTAIPGFLMKTRAVPMTPAPVMGPPDLLEQAILDGKIWEMSAAPVEIGAFDAEHDVISVIVEEGEGTVQFDVQDGRDGVQILANGIPMARVAAQGRAFSTSNIRVLQPRQPI